MTRVAISGTPAAAPSTLTRAWQAAAAARDGGELVGATGADEGQWRWRRRRRRPLSGWMRGRCREAAGIGLAPRLQGARRSSGADHPHVAVGGRPGRTGRVSGGGGGGGGTPEGTRGGTRGNRGGGGWGSGAPGTAGRQPRRPGRRADQSAAGADCDEPLSLSDVDEAGSALFLRDPARHRRAPRVAVGAEYGFLPWGFFPVRDGESEADRATRLGAHSSTVAVAA